MAIQVDFRFLLLVFALVRLPFVGKLSPCYELWIQWRKSGWWIGADRESRREGRVKIKSLTNQMESYIHHLQYLHRPNSLLHSKPLPNRHHRHFNPGKWREAKQQQSNQIQTLGQSIGSEVCTQHDYDAYIDIQTYEHEHKHKHKYPTSQCIINAFDYNVECVLHIICFSIHHGYLFSIWHITPMWFVRSYSSHCCKMPMMLCECVCHWELYAFVRANVLDRCHSFDISNGYAFMIP